MKRVTQNVLLSFSSQNTNTELRETERNNRAFANLQKHFVSKTNSFNQALVAAVALQYSVWMEVSDPSACLCVIEQLELFR